MYFTYNGPVFSAVPVFIESLLYSTGTSIVQTRSFAPAWFNEL